METHGYGDGNRNPAPVRGAPAPPPVTWPRLFVRSRFFLWALRRLCDALLACFACLLVWVSLFFDCVDACQVWGCALAWKAGVRGAGRGDRGRGDGSIGDFILFVHGRGRRGAGVGWDCGGDDGSTRVDWRVEFRLKESRTTGFPFRGGIVFESVFQCVGCAVEEADATAVAAAVLRFGARGFLFLFFFFSFVVALKQHRSGGF